MLTLLSETAELALDLLEKNDVLLPFCKVRTPESSTTIITPNGAEGEDGFEKAAQSVRVELRRQVEAGTVVEFAFCSDSFIKLQGEPQERRFLKVEFQNGKPESGEYLFPLSMENQKANLGTYLVADLREKLL